MGYGRSEQIEHQFDYGKRGINRRSRKELKRHKHKRERHRAKEDPECFEEYRKYGGWEY